MLDLIRDNPRAAELLADVFDFDLNRAEHGEQVRLASGGSLQAVAGDASGGTFFVCDDGAVLYASSEGSAGILATDLTGAVQLLIGVPVWQDVVTDAPDLDAMRATYESSYAEMKEDFEPEIAEHQAEIATLLGLAPVPVTELLTRLRDSLADTDHVLLGEEGTEHDPL